MRIPLSAPDITAREIAAVTSVLASPRLSMGQRLLDFEAGVASYVNAKLAVGVSSGTAGLHLAVRSLGLGPGDEVITTPFSFVSSANVLLYEGCTPVFADIEADSLNLDPAAIERAITSRTKAIMVVHVFGRPARMRAIMELARRYDLLVIEDACEAIGADCTDGMVGSIGDAGVFAFYPNKQITTGEGGMVVTSNEETARRMRMLRNQGRDPELDWLDHVELGYNYRMSELNAALGLAQLQRIDEILALRTAAARRYIEQLQHDPNLVLPPLIHSDGRTSWFVFVVRLAAHYTRADRDRIVQNLSARGIACGRYFAPIHLQPYYSQWFGYTAGNFPVAEHTAERVIALPFFTRISDDQIAEVCETFLTLL